MAHDPTPPWDQEGTLAQARAQVRARVDAKVADRTDGVAMWLSGGDSSRDLESIATAGAGVIVGSDLKLWCWPAASLRRLSDVLRKRDGLLVFIEPTADWGWRRPVQLMSRRYRRDIPAELRAAGFSVTTQVRLRHGVIGTHVRGEARHFD